MDQLKREARLLAFSRSSSNTLSAFDRESSTVSERTGGTTHTTRHLSLFRSMDTPSNCALVSSEEGGWCKWTNTFRSAHISLISLRFSCHHLPLEVQSDPHKGASAQTKRTVGTAVSMRIGRVRNGENGIDTSVAFLYRSRVLLSADWLTFVPSSMPFTPIVPRNCFTNCMTPFKFIYVATEVENATMRRHQTALYREPTVRWCHRRSICRMMGKRVWISAYHSDWRSPLYWVSVQLSHTPGKSNLPSRSGATRVSSLASLQHHT